MTQNREKLEMENIHELDAGCEEPLDNMEDQSYNIVASCLDDFSEKCLGQIDSLKELLKTKEAQKKNPSKTINQWIGLRLNTQIKNRQSLGILLYTAKMAQMHSGCVPSQLEQDILRQLRKLNILELPVKSMKKTNRRVRIEQILLEEEGEPKRSNSNKACSELFESQHKKQSLKNLTFLSQRFQQNSESIQEELDRLEQPNQTISSAENDRKLRLQFNSNHVLVILDLIENALAILRFLQDSSSETSREELLIRIYSSGSLKLRVPNHSIGKVKPKYIETIFGEIDDEDKGICVKQEQEQVEGDNKRMNDEDGSLDDQNEYLLNSSRYCSNNTCNEDSSLLVFQSQCLEENMIEKEQQEEDSRLLDLSLSTAVKSHKTLPRSSCSYFNTKFTNLVYSQNESSQDNPFDSLPFTELNLSLVSTEFSFSEVYH